MEKGSSIVVVIPCYRVKEQVMSLLAGIGPELIADQLGLSPDEFDQRRRMMLLALAPASERRSV